MSAYRRLFGRDGEEGQAVVVFAIVMLALIFVVGLAIDAGQLYVAKRTEQEAADAGAFAGAVVLYQGGNNLQAIQAARDDVRRNGYEDGIDNTSVLVYIPPLSGAYAGNSRHVEVVITRNVRTALMPAEGAFNPVRARGVAGAEGLNNTYAIMALDRGNVPSALNVSKNADIHVVGGGVLVNSTNSTAAATSDQDSNSRFNMTPTTASIDVNGGKSGDWPSAVTINTGHVQQPDPFAGFPPPKVCLAGGNCSPVTPVCDSLAACQDGGGNQNPGIYSVQIGGAGKSLVTLNSGIYILKAGVNGDGNADVVSNPGGVLLYNTYSTYPAAPGASPICSDINLDGNGGTSVSAMTTGTWANIVVFQDPACTAAMKISGNGNFVARGSVYLPSGDFVFDGNNATLLGSQLIARRVNVQNGNLSITYTATNTAQPVLPRLAE